MNRDEQTGHGSDFVLLHLLWDFLIIIFFNGISFKNKNIGNFCDEVITIFISFNYL